MYPLKMYILTVNCNFTFPVSVLSTHTVIFHYIYIYIYIYIYTETHSLVLILKELLYNCHGSHSQGNIIIFQDNELKI